MSSKFDKEIIDKETDKDSSNLDCSKDYNSFKEFNVPLDIVTTELENDNNMEVIPQTSFKKEEDIRDFLENNSEYLDINMKNSQSSNENVANKSSDSENLHLEDHFQKSLNNAHKDSCFPCRYCDKIFSHPNSLKLHLPKHTGSTSCGLCQAVLSRKYELKVHMRKKHNIELY